MVNSETWIIQLCPITRSEPEPGEIDYADIFENGGTREMDNIREEVFQDDPFTMSLPDTPSSSGSCVSVQDHTVRIPGERGELVTVELTNMQLFEKLRGNVAGKKRNPVVFEEMVRLAKHLNDPSSIVGDKVGMQVEGARIMDHVVAAFLVDIDSENKVLSTVKMLQPVLHDHATKFGFSADPKYLDFRTILGALRCVMGIGVEVNRIARHKDKVGALLEAGIARIDGN
jgi:hypothetical protein